jgi:hypothetical protein
MTPFIIAPVARSARHTGRRDISHHVSEKTILKE